MQAATAGLAAQFPEEASSAAGRIGLLRAEAPPGPAADLYRLAHAMLSQQVTPDLLDEVAELNGDAACYLQYAREGGESLERQAVVVAFEIDSLTYGQLGDA
ncbi:MAG: hypothetical protein WD080_09595 [Egibacteraceae bacterium]